MSEQRLASGWRWGSEAGARTLHHQGFSSRSQSNPSDFSAAAVIAGLLAADPSFSQKIGENFSAELRSLAKEPNSEFFFEQMLAFGGRLEAAGKVEPAGEIYYAMLTPHPGPLPQGEREKTPSPLAGEGARMAGEGSLVSIKNRTQQRLDALQGRGAVGLRAEVLIRDFSDTATDYRVIAPMIVGSALFQITKTATLGRLAATPRATWLTRGFGARAASSLLATTVEVPAFSLLSRGLMDLSGAPVSWDANAVGKDLLGAGITLSALKLSGWAGSSLPFVRGGPHRTPLVRVRWGTGWGRALASTSTFLGLLGAHKLEEYWNLRPQVDGATFVTDTLASLVSLEAGGSLGRRLLGRRFVGFQQELALRNEAAARPLGSLFPELAPQVLAVAGVGSLAPRDIRTKGPTVLLSERFNDEPTDPEAPKSGGLTNTPSGVEPAEPVPQSIPIAGELKISAPRFAERVELDDTTLEEIEKLPRDIQATWQAEGDNAIFFGLNHLKWWLGLIKRDAPQMRAEALVVGGKILFGRWQEKPESQIIVKEKLEEIAGDAKLQIHIDPPSTEDWWRPLWGFFLSNELRDQVPSPSRGEGEEILAAILQQVRKDSNSLAESWLDEIAVRDFDLSERIREKAEEEATESESKLRAHWRENFEKEFANSNTIKAINHNLEAFHHEALQGPLNEAIPILAELREVVEKVAMARVKSGYRKASPVSAAPATNNNSFEILAKVAEILTEIEKLNNNEGVHYSFDLVAPAYAALAFVIQAAGGSADGAKKYFDLAREIVEEQAAERPLARGVDYAETRQEIDEIQKGNWPSSLFLRPIANLEKIKDALVGRGDWETVFQELQKIDNQGYKAFALAKVVMWAQEYGMLPPKPEAQQPVVDPVISPAAFGLSTSHHQKIAELFDIMAKIESQKAKLTQIRLDSIQNEEAAKVYILQAIGRNQEAEAYFKLNEEALKKFAKKKKWAVDALKVLQQFREGTFDWSDYQNPEFQALRDGVQKGEMEKVWQRLRQEADGHWPFQKLAYVIHLLQKTHLPSLQPLQELQIQAGQRIGLGRHPDNLIQFKDPLVSRNHGVFELIHRQGRWQVQYVDLSSNGTEIQHSIHRTKIFNGASTTLKGGESLTVGQTRFSVYSPNRLSVPLRLEFLQVEPETWAVVGIPLGSAPSDLNKKMLDEISEHADEFRRRSAVMNQEDAIQEGAFLGYAVQVFSSLNGKIPAAEYLAADLFQKAHEGFLMLTLYPHSGIHKQQQKLSDTVTRLRVGSWRPDPQDCFFTHRLIQYLHEQGELAAAHDVVLGISNNLVRAHATAYLAYLVAGGRAPVAIQARNEPLPSPTIDLPKEVEAILGPLLPIIDDQTKDAGEGIRQTLLLAYLAKLQGKKSIWEDGILATQENLRLMKQRGVRLTPSAEELEIMFKAMKEGSWRPDRTWPFQLGIKAFRDGKSLKEAMAALPRNLPEMQKLEALVHLVQRLTVWPTPWERFQKLFGKDLESKIKAADHPQKVIAQIISGRDVYQFFDQGPEAEQLHVRGWELINQLPQDLAGGNLEEVKTNLRKSLGKSTQEVRSEISKFRRDPQMEEMVSLGYFEGAWDQIEMEVGDKQHLKFTAFLSALARFDKVEEFKNFTGGRISPISHSQGGMSNPNHFPTPSIDHLYGRFENLPKRDIETIPHEYRQLIPTPKDIILFPRFRDMLNEAAYLITAPDRIAIRFFGPPGTSKTTVPEMIAGKMGIPLLRFPFSKRTDASDLEGIWTREVIDGELVPVFKEGPPTIAMEFGYHLALDEPDLGRPGVLASLNNISAPGEYAWVRKQSGELVRIKVHQDYRVWATENGVAEIAREEHGKDFIRRFVSYYVGPWTKEEVTQVLTALFENYGGNRRWFHQTTELLAYFHDVMSQLAAGREDPVTKQVLPPLGSGVGQQIQFTPRSVLRLAQRLVASGPLSPQTLSRAIRAEYILPLADLADREMVWEQANAIFKPMAEKLKWKLENWKGQGLIGPKIHPASVDSPKYLGPHRIPQPTEESISKKYLGGKAFPQGSFIWTDQALRLADEILWNRSLGIDVMLLGEAGEGKTEMPQQIARLVDLPYYQRVASKDTDEEDLVGGLGRTNGKIEFIPGPVTLVTKNGGVGHIDEYLLSDTGKLEAVFNPLMDGAKALIVKNPFQVFARDPNAFFIFTSNPPFGEYADRQEQSGAAMSRVAVMFLTEEFAMQPQDRMKILKGWLAGPEAKKKVPELKRNLIAGAGALRYSLGSETLRQPPPVIPLPIHPEIQARFKLPVEFHNDRIRGILLEPDGQGAWQPIGEATKKSLQKYADYLTRRTRAEMVPAVRKVLKIIYQWGKGHSTDLESGTITLDLGALLAMPLDAALGVGKHEYAHGVIDRPSEVYDAHEIGRLYANYVGDPRMNEYAGSLRPDFAEQIDALYNVIWSEDFDAEKREAFQKALPHEQFIHSIVYFWRFGKIPPHIQNEKVRDALERALPILQPAFKIFPETLQDHHVEKAAADFYEILDQAYPIYKELIPEAEKEIMQRLENGERPEDLIAEILMQMLPMGPGPALPGDEKAEGGIQVPSPARGEGANLQELVKKILEARAEKLADQLEPRDPALFQQRKEQIAALKAAAQAEPADSSQQADQAQQKEEAERPLSSSQLQKIEAERQQLIRDRLQNDLFLSKVPRRAIQVAQRLKRILPPDDPSLMEGHFTTGKRMDRKKANEEDINPMSDGKVFLRVLRPGDWDANLEMVSDVSESQVAAGAVDNSLKASATGIYLAEKLRMGFGEILFGSKARVAQPLGQALHSYAKKNELLNKKSQAFQDRTINGSTNLREPIALALQSLKRHKAKVNYLLLITDGGENLIPRDPTGRELFPSVPALREQAKKEGVRIMVLAMGHAKYYIPKIFDETEYRIVADDGSDIPDRMIELFEEAHGKRFKEGS